MEKVKKIESEEQLIKEIDSILQQKNFSQEAKRILKETIIYTYRNYHAKVYEASRDYVIAENLKSIQALENCNIISIEDLNTRNKITAPHIDEIVKTEPGKGEMDFVDGKYIRNPNGSYYCETRGTRYENNITLLESPNIHSTCSHELCHLEQGNSPFSSRRSVPFDMELRRLLCEGRAARRADNIEVNELRFYELSDDNTTVIGRASRSYPLYTTIYNILQIIIGDEILEVMAKNNEHETNLDLEEALRQEDPDLLAHIIYILYLDSKEPKQVLEEAIEWSRHYEQINQNNKLSDYQSICRSFKYCNEELINSRKEEESCRKSIQTETSRHEAYHIFLTEVEEEFQEIEKKYQKGNMTEQEFLEIKQQKDEISSFESWIEGQQQYLMSLQECIKKRELEILKLKDNMKESYNELQQSKLSLSESLKKICLTSPSLERSFAYLFESATKSIAANLKNILQVSKADNKEFELRTGSVLSAKLKDLEMIRLQTTIIPNEMIPTKKENILSEPGRQK